MNKKIKFEAYPEKEVKVLIDTALNLEGTRNGIYFKLRLGLEDCVGFRKAANADKCLVVGTGVFKTCAAVKILVATNEAFDTAVSVQFTDTDGNVMHIGSAGSVITFTPDSTGNTGDFTLFYTEGPSVIFSMGASDVSQRDLVFALICDDKEAFQWSMKIAWLGGRCGIAAVLQELRGSGLFLLDEGGDDGDGDKEQH